MGSEEIAPILPDAGNRRNERPASFSAAYLSAWSLQELVWTFRRKNKAFGTAGIDPLFLGCPACSLVISLITHPFLRKVHFIMTRPGLQFGFFHVLTP